MPDGAVGSDDAVGRIVGLIVLDGSGKRCLEDVPVVGMNDSKELLAGVAEGPRVDSENGAGLLIEFPLVLEDVPVPGAHAGGLERQIEAGAALPQRIFGLLMPQAPDRLPPSVAPDQGVVMAPEQVRHLGGRVLRDGIAADREHAARFDPGAGGGLVLEEDAPLFFRQPGDVAGQPQAVEASREGELLPVVPSAQYAVWIERACQGIPLALVEDLRLTPGQVGVQVGNRFAQGFPGVLRLQRRGSDPHAVFVVGQTLAKVPDEQLDQVLRGLVELADVRSPGDARHGFDSRSAHPGSS